MVKVVDRVALALAGTAIVFETFQETPNLVVFGIALLVAFVAAAAIVDEIA